MQERFRPRLTKRPKFAEVAKLTAIERGQATHTVLQHLDLTKPLDADGIKAQIEKMVMRRLLGEQEAEGVDVDAIVSFFTRPLGQRLKDAAGKLMREVPFSLSLPASEFPDAASTCLTDEEQNEIILIQGVIDCLIPEEDGFVLIDYKTDEIKSDQVSEATERYRTQISLYRRAVEEIYRQGVKESYLAFLGAGTDVRV